MDVSLKNIKNYMYLFVQTKGFDTKSINSIFNTEYDGSVRGYDYLCVSIE